MRWRRNRVLGGIVVPAKSALKSVRKTRPNRSKWLSHTPLTSGFLHRRRQTGYRIWELPCVCIAVWKLVKKSGTWNVIAVAFCMLRLCRLRMLLSSWCYPRDAERRVSAMERQGGCLMLAYAAENKHSSCQQLLSAFTSDVQSWVFLLEHGLQGSGFLLWVNQEGWKIPRKGSGWTQPQSPNASASMEMPASVSRPFLYLIPTCTFY